MANFPDAATVHELQEYGVRTVVLHTGLTLGTPQQAAARKPVTGLPLRRCRLPDHPGLVVYEVGSSKRQPGAERGFARRRRLGIGLSAALAGPHHAQRHEGEQQRPTPPARGRRCCRG